MTPLEQVAAVQNGDPERVLAAAAVRRVVQGDLRLALNERWTRRCSTQSPTVASRRRPRDPLLVSIRKAITTLRAAGYAPDVLILDPTSDETLDTLLATPTAGEEFYVFTPGSAAPGSIFGLNRRVSKSAAAPVVVDTQAFGRLYA